jgi:hypothetical protein
VVMGGSGGASRGLRRIGRTEDAIRGLRKEISVWFEARGEDLRFARFASQFRALRAVLDRMLDSLVTAVSALPTKVDIVYHECRVIDRGVLAIQRVFDWCAGKYDQRLEPASEKVLLAADEVVRSCSTEPFTVLHADRSTGPLAYLDNRFDTFATPRVSVPTDLRAPADAIVAEHVRELPIPTIALPAWAAREAWCLVLAAHETGHHIQHDLSSGLEASTRQALAAAVAGFGGSETLASAWWGWALEAFTDAYSVLMVGDDATWAIDELQNGTPADLVTGPEPGDRYPPPAVRLALLGELGHRAGVGGAWPGAAEMAAWLDGLDAGAVSQGARRAAQDHLTVTPATAAALLDLPVVGSTLRGVSGLRPAWFGADSRVQRWARDLRQSSPSFGAVGDRPAARQAIAAGVMAWTGAQRGGAADAIHANLLDLLPRCGEPGVLAAPPEPSSVEAVASKLASRLLRDVAKDPAW